MAAFLVLFFFIEAEIIMSRKGAKDVFDFFFPSMAIFERLNFIKFLFLPMLFGIREYYILYYRSQFHNVMQGLEIIEKNNDDLIKKKYNSLNKLEQTNDLVKKALETMKKEKDSRQLASKTPLWKKIIFYFCIGFIVLGSFYDNKVHATLISTAEEFYDIEE